MYKESIKMVQGPHQRRCVAGAPTQSSFYDNPEYEDLKPSSAEQDFVAMTNDGGCINFETLEDALNEAQETLQICEISYNSINGNIEIKKKFPGSLWSVPEEERILALCPSYIPHQDTIWVHTNLPLLQEKATYIYAAFPDIPEQEKTNMVVAASIVAVYTFPIIT